MRTRIVAAAAAVVVAAGGSAVALDATDTLDLRIPGVGPVESEPTTPSASIPARLPIASRLPPPVVARPVLPPVDGSLAPDAAVLASRLAPLLKAKALAGGASATVLDVESGRRLVDFRGSTPRAPASVTKIVTAASVLDTVGPDATLATTVVAGRRNGELILVGHGDPTVSSVAQPRGTYPRHASLDQLAARTAQALGKVKRVRLLVDDTYFSGPSISPAWQSNYVPDGIASRVSALTVDEARLRPSPTGQDVHQAPRAADPAVHAGQEFVRLLGAHGVTAVGAVARAKAAPSAKTYAEVQSPPVRLLIEQMLRTSDNDIAEALARVAARAGGKPASFAGVSKQQAETLAGLPGAARPAVPGAVLYDGSGLSRKDRLTSRSLAALIASTASDTSTAQRRRGLLSGLPVGGFNGTLSQRYRKAPTAAGAGTVRAKTGSLTGVTTLAGDVVDTNGRLLAFAVLVNGVKDPVASRAAMDRIAATLAGCGCR